MISADNHAMSKSGMLTVEYSYHLWVNVLMISADNHAEFISTV